MKRILITGGSRGIGRATALLAAARGWSVAFTYVHDRQAAHATAAEITAAGGQPLALRADIAEEADIVAAFAAATGAFGGLDGVVANAGIVAAPSPLADMELPRLRRMFEVNVLGTYLTVRQAARTLPRDRGGAGGAIVILSSAAARLGSPGEYVDYAGSKAALDTLTLGLAKELGGQGVRVNAVRPGIIATDIHASGGQPDRAARLGPHMPLQRPGTAEEVGQAIIWLLSDFSSYVTGAILDVAGGR